MKSCRHSMRLGNHPTKLLSIWLITLSLQTLSVQAEMLKTDIPQQQYNIPAGDLAKALTLYAGYSGILLSFDSVLTSNKTTQGLKGQFSLLEGFEVLLKGTGLEIVQGQDGRYQLRHAVLKPKPIPGAPEKEDKTLKLEGVEVRAKRFYEVGPLPGLGLTKEEIPGNVQSLTANDIKEAHALSLADLMNSKLQSVNVNDYQGNPFQMDVQYRGFTAGPQIGTPQGLSAFIDGIRINEPFGDVVNWDLIPLNALSSFDVFPGSNPIFGLGTLGGALSMKTKDGFNNVGGNADILTGSFGRKQLQLDGGWNNGTIGLFAAGNFFLEDGWRENSPSRVNQLFTKASYRGDKLDLNFSTLLAQTDLVGNGLIPSEMYARDRDGVYTSPDTTKNTLAQFQLSGSYFVNDNFTITAQAYRRNSKRKSLGADVYTQWEGVANIVKRNLNPGEQFTCLFNSSNKYGLPNYYIVPAVDGRFTASRSQFLRDVRDFGIGYALAQLPAEAFNADLPEDFAAYAQAVFKETKNFEQANFFVPGAQGASGLAPPDATPYSNNAPQYNYNPSQTLTSIAQGGIGLSEAIGMGSAFYYFEEDADGGVGTKYVMIIDPQAAVNGNACQGDVYDPVANNGLDPLQVPVNGGSTPQTADGAIYGTGPGSQGVIEGSPTAILTNTQIDQITDGASIQFNWNFEKHKFMIGASIDAPSATYKNGQMLGMLDAERNAYLAPDEIRDQYAAASQEISNNNFDGNQLTKSIYASETWSPIDALHFTGALRYNETHGKNTISSRTHGSFVWDLAQLQAFPDYYNVCVNGVCPTTGYITPDASNILNKPETEKFRYYSLNPSLGATWQATPNVNVYGNVAQGTRVPSVVELGCAFDKTPVQMGTDGNGAPIYVPRSLAENRFCSLPTTLSGDPYLPQIKATSFDLGMRGRFNDNLEWNLGIYRTDLKDDIYMIGYPGNRNFFDTVGNTRRQGIEAGITGAIDKWRLRLNYALTEATFQDSFWMPANDNSSSVEDVYGMSYSRRIQVQPGNRMPGVPLHNLNATVSYAVTPKWLVGLTAVAHSSAFVRGNENNKHQPGVVISDTVKDPNGALMQISRQPTSNPGTTPGYMTFNFQTSYKLSAEWTLGLRVNNIFDKEYFSAGRLGRNPFSPSISGAVGPSGYNHNSNDWLMTNFLAPGAPRGAWMSLTYQFDPNK